MRALLAAWLATTVLTMVLAAIYFEREGMTWWNGILFVALGIVLVVIVGLLVSTFKEKR